MTTPPHEVYLIIPRKYNKRRPSVDQPYCDNLRLITLTQGQVAKVGVCDYEWLTQWNWAAQYDPHTQSFYASRQYRVSSSETVRVLMHRQILNLMDEDLLVDHRNGDTLDNQRSNLRQATHSQNGQNRKINRSHALGLKGVSRKGNAWSARIRLKSVLIHLGNFATPELAHAAYCEAAERYFGTFARLDDSIRTS